jgi:hypothetical protein
MVTRRAGGPDGIIGTNVENRSSKISWHIFELGGSYMDPLSDLCNYASLVHLILYILSILSK